MKAIVNKKGFTLIELLAVIAILSIMAVFVVPNIIDLYNDGKEKALEVEKKNILASAKEYYHDCLYGDLNCSNTIIAEGNIKKITVETLINSEYLENNKINGKNIEEIFDYITINSNGTYEVKLISEN